MEAVRTWLTSVVMVSMLLSLVQLLIPKGGVQKIAGFTGSLILLLALLQPLLRIELAGILPDMEEHRVELARRQKALMEETEKRLEQGIARETEAYISDKARSLGEEVSVRVITEVSPEGVPVPAEVEITGPYLPELAVDMERELGISGERQVWHEDEN